MSLSLRFSHWRRGIEAVNAHLTKSTVKTRQVLQRYGAQIGEGGVLTGPITIENAAPDYRKLVIGRNVHIGRGVFLDLAAPLIIEDEAVISMGATLLTHFSVGDRPLRHVLGEGTAPLTIGASAYIGANATILMGCSIGEMAVVGAGAVVTKPVGPGETVVGVPARTTVATRTAAEL